ncbi:hypothetical protein GGE68_002955 [Rhizobium leguminosarum]|uniref:hypothetical protein n=1 Tax=Rhizobium leguminosarum TaxID=384 RepID=UPI001613040D|nr:hypothetical protein [Rhizobium leguminosarum]MBB5664758.1 hypothetical protein [Rhizobium leguminosarum]
MKSIALASAIAATFAVAALTTPANAQAVVSKDCTLSRYIEAYAWQALDDAERANVSQPTINGLRVYLRTTQQATKRACGV